MSSRKRTVFSFLYARRGETTLWDRKGFDQSEASEDEAPGAKLGVHDHKLEWYRVVVEFLPDEEREEACDRAEDEAEAEFRKHHPNALLAE